MTLSRTHVIRPHLWWSLLWQSPLVAGVPAMAALLLNASVPLVVAAALCGLSCMSLALRRYRIECSAAEVRAFGLISSVTVKLSDVADVGLEEVWATRGVTVRVDCPDDTVARVRLPATDWSVLLPHQQRELVSRIRAGAAAIDRQ